MGIRLRCYRCQKVWSYKGKSSVKVTCPDCNFKIDKKKARLNYLEKTKGGKNV